MTLQCNTAATNSLSASLESNVIFISLKKKSFLVIKCNMFCSSAHTAKIAHVIRLHSLKAERRETLKDILGMHWLNTPPKTYFCSTVLFCLLSVFGNADERMAIRSPPFTCKYQLHGNVQVFTGKWSRDLPNLCFLY